jgi:signal transduction histidine kinase
VQNSFDKHNYLQRTPEVECINRIPQSLILTTAKRYLAIVIDNLLRNAYQHTFQGSITVAIKGSCILIEDTGEGMASSLAGSVSCDNVLEKSGLGLSIVRRLCEKLGWQISINSNTEQGTGIIIDVAQDAL